MFLWHLNMAKCFDAIALSSCTPTRSGWEVRWAALLWRRGRSCRPGEAVASRCRKVHRSPLLEMARNAPCCHRGLQQSVQSCGHSGIFFACPSPFWGPHSPTPHRARTCVSPCWFGRVHLSELTSCSDSSGHTVALFSNLFFNFYC